MGDLLAGVETKRRLASEKAESLRLEFRERKQRTDAIARMISPILLLVLVVIVRTDPTLIIPFALVVSLLKLTFARWRVTRDIRWTSVLIGGGLCLYLISNWGHVTWMRTKSDIAPELAGAALIAILFIVFRWSRTPALDRWMIVPASSIVVFATILAVDVPGLSLTGKMNAFVSSLAVEMIGAGYAILTLLDELNDASDAPLYKQ